MRLAPTLALLAVLLAQVPWLYCHCGADCDPEAVLLPNPVEERSEVRAPGACPCQHGHADEDLPPGRDGESDEPTDQPGSHHEKVTALAVVGERVGLDAPTVVHAPLLADLPTRATIADHRGVPCVSLLPPGASGPPGYTECVRLLL